MFEVNANNAAMNYVVTTVYVCALSVYLVNELIQ